MGLGVVAAILSGMYGGANFGNNWNRLCLSNEIGINTVTLLNILKIEKDGKGYSPDVVQKYEISSADIKAFLSWRNG